MKSSRVLLVCGFILLAAAGFASGAFESGPFDWVSGSGYVKTENRSVPDFSAIVVEGSGNVTLSQGIRQPVSVETDDNILPCVKTEVIGGVLHLGFKEGTRVHQVTRLEFRVTSPRIEGITISGSGDVHGANTIAGSAMALEIHGSGNIEAELDVGHLNTHVGGSGDVSVRGKADDESITINGSGGVRAQDLAADTASVSISGSGDALVNAARTISINITGSGSVEYGGGAKATVHASGSGSVRQF